MSKESIEDPKIMIWDVEGGDSADKENLMHCYFEAGSLDIYQFFSGKGDLIPTIPEFLLADTPAFQFIRAGMLWTVSEFEIDQRTEKAHGRWRNPRHPARGDDDGHFQAQSGPPATASVATA